MVGLDLQDHCCVAIFTDFYWYVAGLIQAGGRLIRLSQRKEVIVHILKVKDSYYDYIERIIRFTERNALVDSLFNPHQEETCRNYMVADAESQDSARTTAFRKAAQLWLDPTAHRPAGTGTGPHFSL
ncbi:uncharacterized protein LY79DRAFT_704376 [Colletotrichum navitas]|uniref:Uncharacterized protein n=1 Tax=Colletotrichum navitas TaxID=681940 RepID=A0AAD8PXU5_9PEZI|nr:uncharacterized protein LY79DRAFT_704376 [Colletotrichum navitas]KAK1586183.1 hypothetical protein LY79DRAFT_704376 [Colletotrichum navitas]